MEDHLDLRDLEGGRYPVGVQIGGFQNPALPVDHTVLVRLYPIACAIPPSTCPSAVSGVDDPARVAEVPHLKDLHLRGFRIHLHFRKDRGKRRRILLGRERALAGDVEVFPVEIVGGLPGDLANGYRPLRVGSDVDPASLTSKAAGSTPSIPAARSRSLSLAASAAFITA